MEVELTTCLVFGKGSHIDSYPPVMRPLSEYETAGELHFRFTEGTTKQFAALGWVTTFSS